MTSHLQSGTVVSSNMGASMPASRSVSTSHSALLLPIVPEHDGRGRQPVHYSHSAPTSPRALHSPRLLRPSGLSAEVTSSSAPTSPTLPSRPSRTSRSSGPSGLSRQSHPPRTSGSVPPMATASSSTSPPREYYPRAKTPKPLWPHKPRSHYQQHHYQHSTASSKSAGKSPARGHSRTDYTREVRRQGPPRRFGLLEEEPFGDHDDEVETKLEAQAGETSGKRSGKRSWIARHGGTRIMTVLLLISTVAVGLGVGLSFGLHKKKT